MFLQVGDMAEDLDLRRPDGRRICLSEFSTTVVLIFLRHLA